MSDAMCKINPCNPDKFFMNNLTLRNLEMP
jgi:hypothetical protein